MNGRTILVTLNGSAATRQHQARKIHVTKEGVLVLMADNDRVLVTYAAGTWLSAEEQE